MTPSSHELESAGKPGRFNGDHDLDTAQLLLEQRGHPEAIAYHIQQSIESEAAAVEIQSRMAGRRPENSIWGKVLL